MGGRALRFAHEELRDHPDIVLAAVVQDGTALEFASAALRSDFVFAVKAVVCKETALPFVPLRLRIRADFLEAINEQLSVQTLGVDVADRGVLPLQSVAEHEDDAASLDLVYDK